MLRKYDGWEYEGGEEALQSHALYPFLTIIWVYWNCSSSYSG